MEEVTAKYILYGITPGTFFVKFSTAITVNELYARATDCGTEIEMKFPNEICQNTFEWALRFFEVPFKKLE